MSAGEERARATFWLLDAPDSLRTQSHREPDGTGLGWFARDGSPRVSKQALAAYADAAFARRAREVASRTFIAHIRFASPGSLAPQNTHPFEQHGRLFAHNGVIEDLPALEAHLGSDMRMVEGDTDSERFFALITREIAAREGDIEGGITAACAWVAAHLPVFAINFVLATAEGLWALRYPRTHALFLLRRAPGAELRHASSFGTRVTSAHGSEKPLAVIASERLDADTGWKMLAPGELVSVAPTLEVGTRSVLGSPPARPLSLADLSARARRSQAKPLTASD